MPSILSVAIILISFTPASAGPLQPANTLKNSTEPKAVALNNASEIFANSAEKPITATIKSPVPVPVDGKQSGPEAASSPENATVIDNGNDPNDPTAATPEADQKRPTSDYQPPDGIDEISAEDDADVAKSGAKKSDKSTEKESDKDKDTPAVKKNPTFGDFDEPEDTHFLWYIVLVGGVVVLTYIAIHNKKRIMGYLIEGRTAQSSRSRRGNVRYRRLSQRESLGPDGGDSGAKEPA